MYCSSLLCLKYFIFLGVSSIMCVWKCVEVLLVWVVVMVVVLLVLFCRLVMLIVFELFRFRFCVFLLVLNCSGSMFMLIRLEWWMCLKFLVIIVLMLSRLVFLVV